ncbi:hypothetical protein NP493_232g02004 [Ridgeia piscesae]|uniref:CARD domain-containing protein n=1 Tax=Ridgeia piscesae TaxID=27915 RepID=A0AAD9UDL6_RIDPI|nr:hypothetical protein NP493_232g02004 [Ridgeia piscesae]
MKEDDDVTILGLNQSTGPSMDEFLGKLIVEILPRWSDVVQRIAKQRLISTTLLEQATSPKLSADEQIATILQMVFFDSRDYMAEELAATLQKLGMTDAAFTTRQVINARAANSKLGFYKPRSHKAVLDESEATFVDCLRPSRQLLEILRAAEVLSDEMVSKIVCRPTRQDRVKMLFEFLMGLGSKSVYTFIDALRVTDQDYLANILAANEMA